MPARLSALVAVALLVPLASAAAWADAVVNGSHRTEMLDCAGAPASVNGDANRVVFHGRCSSLRIAGTGNQVEIDLLPGGAVSVTGSDNAVQYTPIVPGPAVTVQGGGNSIAAGHGAVAGEAVAPAVPTAPPAAAVISPPSRAEAGTLLLQGDAAARNVDCTGRNVLIEGSGRNDVLRGGCRSVTVQGRMDTVRAELQPGARIALGGDGITLHYTQTTPGPSPVISVTGNDSRALTASAP